MNRKVQRELAKQRYKLHQETKKDRLEELKEKISGQDISDAFKYGATCNSVFGKRKILSRKRINQIIINK